MARAGFGRYTRVLYTRVDDVTAATIEAEATAEGKSTAAYVREQLMAPRGGVRLNRAERDYLATLMRHDAATCRRMRGYPNGEDYVGALRRLHSIARKVGIDAAELEDL